MYYLCPIFKKLTLYLEHCFMLLNVFKHDFNVMRLWFEDFRSITLCILLRSSFVLEASKSPLFYSTKLQYCKLLSLMGSLSVTPPPGLSSITRKEMWRQQLPTPLSRNPLSTSPIHISWQTSTSIGNGNCHATWKWKTFKRMS